MCRVYTHTYDAEFTTGENGETQKGTLNNNCSLVSLSYIISKDGHPNCWNDCKMLKENQTGSFKLRKSSINLIQWADLCKSNWFIAGA